jgi:hypothetical protein
MCEALWVAFRDLLGNLTNFKKSSKYTKIYQKGIKGNIII